MYIKLLLGLSGIIMMLQGAFFYIFSEMFTFFMFPEANDQAIEVGRTLLELISGALILTGILLFLSRKNVTSASKRILFGSSLGFAIIFFLQLKIVVLGDAVIFLPVLVLWALLAIISFYISYKSY